MGNISEKYIINIINKYNENKKVCAVSTSCNFICDFKR